MKELSIEEKAKRYDEAIEKAKYYYDEGKTLEYANDIVSDIFPELKESDESNDEKIRKRIIRALHGDVLDMEETTEAIAWLEKQGNKDEEILILKDQIESLHAARIALKEAHKIELEKQGEYKNIDSDDLATLEIWEDAIKENKEKWQLSDWFVEATSLLIQKVKCMENNENFNIKGSKIMLNACINVLREIGHSHLSDWLEKQGEQKPVVIPKFRVGDIIKDTEDGEVFTIRTITKDKYIYTDDSFDWIKDQDEYELVEQKPAEDIDLPEFESYLCLMFQKFRAKGMCTNGEIIDYVKEHSQKLRDILVKPAWSEEDEKMLNNAISACNHCYFQDTIEWLKSLKERVQPQTKKEWSEEDETKIKSIIALLKSPTLCAMDGNKGIVDESIKYLKSLKDRVQPQNKWKESLATADLENSLCDIQDGFSDTSYEYRILGEAIEFIRCTEPKPQWKPSDEQILALAKASETYCDRDKNTLYSLYNDLKKLREE